MYALVQTTIDGGSCGKDGVLTGFRSWSALGGVLVTGVNAGGPPYESMRVGMGWDGMSM